MTALATPNGAKPKPAERPSLAGVTTKSSGLPNRILFHAVQKWGKTSLAAQAPGVIFLCTRGEDGLDTLIKTGQLPETPHFPGTFTTWNHLMLALQELYLEQHPYKTAAIDTVNGAANLCIEHVTQKHFGGDVSKFEEYGRGMKPGFTPKEWQQFLDILDKLRTEKNMAIVLLAHSQVKTVSNPGTSSYDRWEPVMPKELSAMTDRWVDMILFGGFEVFTDAKRLDQKGRATGGTNRIIHTTPSAIINAGHRHGLPEEIECGDSPKEAWANFIAALHPNRKDKTT